MTAAGFVVRLCARLLLLLVLASPAAAQQNQERRIALVVGDAAYGDAALPTTANDAGLIAQQLQAAGFDVSGARDLDGDTLRRAFRDFVDKARQAGPGSVALVYFAGYGLQFEGENYVVPIDAQIPTAADVPIQAVRVSDLMGALAQLPLKARIIILDAARENPFARQGSPLASGLALVEPDPGVLIAFNAAPGTVAPAEKTGDAYGPYAQALAEMIRQGGAPLRDVFDQVRLRVSDATKGAVVPWDADRVDANFVFFDRSANAPAPPPDVGLSALRDRPLQDLGAKKAYQAALQRDTIPAYQDFLAAYPNDPAAKRVRAILAARREALTWRRTLENGTANAYWSYLRRYPSGPHAAECRLRLSRLAVAPEPPPDFEPIDYDLPPPPPDEIAFVDRPVLMFGDPDFDLPPPPPVIVLEPPPEYIVDLPPPPPPVDLFVLPIPVYAPLPVWVDRPAYVAPPPVNIIAYNIHNTVIVNKNTVVVKDPAGKLVPPLANAVAAGALPPNAALPPAATPNPEARHGRAGQPPAPNRAAEALPVAATLGVALPPAAAHAQQLRRPASAPAAGGGGAGTLNPVVPPGQPTAPNHALPGQPTAQPLPGQPPQQQREQLQRQRQIQGQPSPGQPTAPSHAPPGEPTAQPLPGQPAQQREQLIQQRREQLQRERQIQGQPAPGQPQILPRHSLPSQTTPQPRPGEPAQQQREQLIQQQHQQQMQQREQMIQQQRQQQMQQREQMIQQQRQQQMQQREQMIQQQRQQQMQQREQMIQQQRQQQMQQREQMIEQQRQQQMQQREQMIQQQRAQQQMQQRQLQMQRAPAAPHACGKPGLPPC